MCQLSDFYHLKLTPYYQECLQRELPAWHQSYLWKGELEGEVLDLGAGCGETAQFFLNHGAKKVVCVEANPQALEYLHYNFGMDPRVRIIDSFIGHIKVDIEGAEWGMVVEAHATDYQTFPKMNLLFRGGQAIYRLEKTRLSRTYPKWLLKQAVIQQGRLRRRLLGK